MRTKISILFLFFAFVLSYTAFAYAAVSDNVSIMAENYRSVSVDLSISSETATVKGSLTGIVGTTTKATVHLYLQQYKDGEWINCEDWIESKDGANCTVTKTMSVAKGYKYRAKASCYAYAGSKSEHVTKYSKEVTY